MKPKIPARVLISACALLVLSLACSLSAPGSAERQTVEVPVTPTGEVIQVAASFTPQPADVFDGTFTRCVTAEVAVWLRSKPWETSKPVTPSALLAGTVVQVYPNPFGEHQWVEVWVPSKRVTGYVNIKYIGECK